MQGSYRVRRICGPGKRSDRLYIKSELRYLYRRKFFLHLINPPWVSRLFCTLGACWAYICRLYRVPGPLSVCCISCCVLCFNITTWNVLCFLTGTIFIFLLDCFFQTEAFLEAYSLLQAYLTPISCF